MGGPLCRHVIGPPVIASGCDVGDAHTVLLVEDDPGIASFVTRALAAKGFTVEWTSSGVAALDRVAAGVVDALILDLNLPDMDGVEVLRTLRERGHRFPVFVVTARTDPESREAARALGVAGYLRKPFPLVELLEGIGQNLENMARSRTDP